MTDYTWLFDDVNGLKQKICFKDRIEYRINGKLHNSKGPAWIGISDDKTVNCPIKYYIKGEELPFEEWSVLIRPTKLKKIMKNIKEKGE